MIAEHLCRDCPEYCVFSVDRICGANGVVKDVGRIVGLMVQLCLKDVGAWV